MATSAHPRTARRRGDDEPSRGRRGGRLAGVAPSASRLSGASDRHGVSDRSDPGGLEHRNTPGHADTPGHPGARGTLPMARHLLDPAIEEEIQALAAEAPRMSEDQRARLARLLRLDRRRA
jgi:hypothetical protein